MRKILIATILPAAMLAGCAKPAEEAVANNIATEEVVAPSEAVENAMDANAMDANAMDANAADVTDQGSTDQRAVAADGSTDQQQ